MLARLAARDGLILLLTGVLWWLDGGLRSRGGLLPGGVALAAAATTALCGYLLHEWGHLAGARLQGAVVHLPERVASVFLFRFDTGCNDRSQFLAMSCGGFLASALVLAFLVVALPLDAISGRLALGFALLGVVATFVLEVPVAWRVARGAALPEGMAYRSTPPT